MKKILLFALLVCAINGFGQSLPGYTNVNDKYRHLGLAPLGFNVPAGSAPTFTSTQTRISGATYVDTIGGGAGFWYFRSATWRRLVDSTELADTAAAIRASITAGSAGVVDADYGDITVTGTGAIWTIDNNVVSNAKLRQSAGLSVIGRSANSTGNVADITAGTDGFVFRRSGATLDFGQIGTAGITDAAVTYAKIQNISATNRVLGRVASSGPPEELTGTQLTAMSDVFTTTLKGVVPPSGGTVGNFLRDDGTWTTAPGSGTVNSGNQYRIGVYLANGTAISENTAITANRALISDANGVPTHSAVTNTELGYSSGVTSAIQTQLNGKQATGNYITALTGDVTASGPGSAAATLATVNSNVGSFTNANLTVNAKGLITSASNGSAGTSYEPLNILGTIYTNNTWNSTIRGTDITEAGGVTAADSSGFLILKNGASNFTQTANIKRSTVLAINPYFTNLEYWSFYIRFYVREKGALAVGITSTAANNLTADAIGYLNTLTGQSNFIATSASNLSTTANDQCEMKVERDGFRTSISVRNITTNSAWITTLGAFSLPLTNTPHTTGQFAIFSYSGWYAIDSVGVHSKAPTYPDLAVIGTSKTEGKNGTPQTRYITKLQTRFNVVEHAGIAETTEEWISNYWELLAMHPKQVILENPCNDLRFGINVDSTKARMYRIERAFRDQGAAVYHLDAIYETNSSPANWLTHLYATRSADSIIYVRAPTAASGALDADGIHPTEVGQDIIYQTIIQSGKIKFGIAPETGNQTAILNQSGSSQIADFDITGTGRVRGFFRVGPQASGTTTFEVSTAANNNVKIYNGGGVNSISSLVDNNGSFTQMYLQASALSFFTSGVQALSLVTSGEATFSGKVNVGCTGCSGTLPFTATGATNQVMSFGYNGTYQQLIFGNSGGSQGRKIRQLASEYDFSVYTTGSVVIPAIEISTTGATTINQSGLALNTIIKGDNDANLFNANGTDDKINIGTGTSTAKVGVLSITEQLRLQYDASNYLGFTTGSTGSTTLDLVGTTPVLTIADSVKLTGIGENIVDTVTWKVLTINKETKTVRYMPWAYAGGSSGMSNPLTTTGDIIYSSSGTTPARLGIGSTNQVLQVVGGVPAWGNVVVSGTYTPTETDVANVSASTPLTFHYSRNGNEVTLTGEAIITPAVGATNTSVSFSLPSGSTSNFTSGGDAGGSGVARENTTRVAGTLSPDTTNDIINFQFTSINTSAHVISFTCIYTIVP